MRVIGCTLIYRAVNVDIVSENSTMFNLLFVVRFDEINCSVTVQ